MIPPHPFTHGDSDIHGQGMFLFHNPFNLSEGAEFYIPGEIHQDDDLMPYSFETSQGWAYLPSYPFIFLNHSDTPNAEVYEGEGGMMLHILQTVGFCEEVTIDYGKGYWE